MKDIVVDAEWFCKVSGREVVCKNYWTKAASSEHRHVRLVSDTKDTCEVTETWQAKTLKNQKHRKFAQCMTKVHAKIFIQKSKTSVFSWLENGQSFYHTENHHWTLRVSCRHDHEMTEDGNDVVNSLKPRMWFRSKGTSDKTNDCRT